MPLPQPQVIDVDMGLGLDTFTDPKRVMPGKFTQLENVRFQRGKRLEMRRGNVAYGGTYKLGNNPGGSVASTLAGQMNGIIPYKDTFGLLAKMDAIPDSLLRVRDTAANTLSPVSSQGVECSIRIESVSKGATVVRACDTVTVGDKTITVYSYGTNPLSAGSPAAFYDVRDASTGRILFSGSFGMGATTAYGVRVVPVSSTVVWLAFCWDVTLYVVPFDLTTLTPFSTVSLAINAESFDFAVAGSAVFTICRVGANVRISKDTNLTAPTLPATLTYAFAGTFRSCGFCQPQTTADANLAFGWYDTTNGFSAGLIAVSTGTTVTAPASKIAAATYSKDAYRITGRARENGANPRYLFVVGMRDAALSLNNMTIVFGLQNAGLFIGGDIHRLDGCYVYSQPCETSGTGKLSFWCQYSNSVLSTKGATQSAMFLFSVYADTGSIFSPPALLARQMYGRTHYESIAGAQPPLTTFNWLASSAAQKFTLGVVDSFQVYDAANARALAGASVLTADFSVRARADLPTANATLVGSGFLGAFDGRNVIEGCHMLAPEPPTTVTPNVAGGSMSNGTYSFVAVFEYYDDTGQLYRSAPSTPTTVALALGGSTQRIDLVWPGCRIAVGTGLILTRTIRLAIYSTQNGLSTYYRLGSFAAIPNYTGTANITISTSRVEADATISANAVLYTTGGVFSNFGIDGPPVLGTLNGRIVAASPIDEGIIYFSKPLEVGVSPEFHPSFAQDVQPMGGKVTALAELGDKCIVFKEDSIGVFTGEGLQASGAGGGYSVTEVLQESLGCVGPWAHTICPLGVIFSSGARGIWLVGRDLSVSYIGEPVYQFNGTEIIKTVRVDDQEEVRFYLTTGTVLVFNWAQGTWSTSTSFPIVDAAYVNGQVLFIRQYASSLGGLYVESDTSFTDAHNGVYSVSAAAITMQAVLGWLNLAGIQGYMRVWRALFTGDYGDSHTLLIDAGYDYDESTYPDSFSLTSANIGLPYDGQVWLRRGYSKAVRLRLRASSLASDTVGPMSLTGLSLEVGILPRGARMKASKGA